MDHNNWIRITVGELQRHKNGKPIYKELERHLRKESITDCFIVRSQHGIGENNEIRMNLLETSPLNNLPIVIDVIRNKEDLSLLSDKLQLTSGQVFEVLTLEQYHHVLLKVYVVERFHWFKPEIYQEIIELCKQNRLIWTTAYKGIGAVMIEVVGTIEEINFIIPSIQNIAPNSKMITIPVKIIENK